jgi:phosphatidylserine/phosphatidylglycerophosphate/cardiolipin synthase-like enzyme
MRRYLALLCCCMIAAAVHTSEASPADGKHEITFIAQDELGATILDKISRAKSRIYLAQHIMGDGQYGRAITAKLMEAARKRNQDGSRVDVRLIYDGLVSSLYAIQAPGRLLVSAGVKVQSYNPKERLFVINHRMHSKLMIIDDEVFVGSSNSHACSTISMVCVESDMMISGKKILRDAVRSYLEYWDHAVTWEIAFPEPVWEAIEQQKQQQQQNNIQTAIAARYQNNIAEYLQAYLPTANRLIAEAFSKQSNPGRSPPRKYPISQIDYVTDPPGKVKNGGMFAQLMEIIASAQKSVRIITPYFFPTRMIKNALASATNNGAHVEIYTTRRDELVNIFGLALTRSFAFVHEHNIDLYEYQQRKLLHSKLFIVDDRIAYLGSANFDSLSQRFNTENGVLIDLQHDADIRQRFNAEIDQVREQSKQVTDNKGPGFFDYRDCSLTTCNPLIKLLNPATELFY